MPIPEGYKDQLDDLQRLFGGALVSGKEAPYWWEGLFDIGTRREAQDDETSDRGEDSDTGNPAAHEEEGEEILRIPRKLWGGWRDIEGYAQEAFRVEERLNKRTWMDDES